MFEEHHIIKLCPNILKRYEPNFDSGTMFLFNVDTQEFWTGNESSYDLIKLVDGNRNLIEIYSKLTPLFEDYELEDIKESFDSLIVELIDKKFVYIVE